MYCKSPDPIQGIRTARPGRVVARRLSRGLNDEGREWNFVTSIVNTNERGLTVTLLPVDLDILNESESSLTLALSAVDASGDRLFKLRNLLRLQHLNGEECLS